MLAGGGTTCVPSAPAPDLASEPPPEALGGGGTGLVRRSPVAVLPQLLRSRLTCDGGGATTAGAGRASFGVDETSRGGAETGGAITSTVCDNGTRELATSLGVLTGAGAMTVGASGVADRIFVSSRETFGAGGITAAGKVGATSDERKPSAGGGPGSGLKASRLATAASECGRFILGASTTFSAGLSPRATRMVCVRWWACWPPARPDLPDCAPPRSWVCGSSSPE